MTPDTMTPQEHLDAAAAAEKSAYDSFERCDTDGFLSQWASGLSAQKHRMAAQVAADGGRAWFAALNDLETGVRVPAKLIEGRYGMCWALVVPGTTEFTGEFISAFPRREATMAEKGYSEGWEWAPALATFKGRGTGLSGSAWACVVRTDDGTGQDPAVIADPDPDEDVEG